MREFLSSMPAYNAVDAKLLLNDKYNELFGFPYESTYANPIPTVTVSPHSTTDNSLVRFAASIISRDMPAKLNMRLDDIMNLDSHTFSIFSKACDVKPDEETNTP